MAHVGKSGNSSPEYWSGGNGNKKHRSSVVYNVLVPLLLVPHPFFIARNP